jgi:hypothetical protein
MTSGAMRNDIGSKIAIVGSAAPSRSRPTSARRRCSWAPPRRFAAMRDAGIGAGRRALFTGRARRPMVLQYNQALLNELKISPTFNSEVTPHGAGAIGTLQLAAVHCTPA